MSALLINKKKHQHQEVRIYEECSLVLRIIQHSIYQCLENVRQSKAVSPFQSQDYDAIKACQFTIVEDFLLTYVGREAKQGCLVVLGAQNGVVLVGTERRLEWEIKHALVLHLPYWMRVIAMHQPPRSLESVMPASNIVLIQRRDTPNHADEGIMQPKQEQEDDLEEYNCTYSDSEEEEEEEESSRGPFLAPAGRRKNRGEDTLQDRSVLVHDEPISCQPHNSKFLASANRPASGTLGQEWCNFKGLTIDNGVVPPQISIDKIDFRLDDSPMARWTKVCGVSLTPQRNDVLIGRSKICFNHPGNVRLRLVIAHLLDIIHQMKSRKARFRMNFWLINDVLRRNGRFLKMENFYDIDWHLGSYRDARIKVGTAVRDAANNKVKCIRLMKREIDKTPI